MTHSLGIDTGGTFTDAVVFERETRRIVASAKALTTRHDLAEGIGAAAGAALEMAGVASGSIGLVAVSTTLATNALVEGQGTRAGLVMIGFSDADLDRAGLRDALGADPVAFVPGGHDVHGRPQPFTPQAALPQLQAMADQVQAFAVAGYFAVRNPAHEIAMRDMLHAATGLPVTCSHELSAKLDGPRRALTTLLNARLVAMIERLLEGVTAVLEDRGIDAPLMVVRGDGSLAGASFARLRPIETILSGPAASLVGARFLTGLDNAVVSDIGGTTTDIAVLENGLPLLDPMGATVGGWRTMVDAVAMRTFGLGGDSEVRVDDGALVPEIRLGPRRAVPVALAAQMAPDPVLSALARQLKAANPGRLDGRFALSTGVPARFATGLSRSEADLFSRLAQMPQPLDTLLKGQAEAATLDRLAARGLALIAAVTPSDALHALGRFGHWDRDAALSGLALMARKRDGAGRPLAPSAEDMALRIVDTLETASARALLETALSHDGLDGAALSRSELARRAIAGEAGLARLAVSFDRPLVGLGAGASTIYPPVGERLHAQTRVPPHAGVANAIGAVVGEVRVHAVCEVLALPDGRFEVTGATGDGSPEVFLDEKTAMTAARADAERAALDRAGEAGADGATATLAEEVRATMLDDQRVFVGATVVATATGAPRFGRVI